MHVVLDDFADIYRKIKDAALEGEVTVLLCVAPEADGLAAAQIFMETLKRDAIRFTLWPVASFSDFDRARDHMRTMPEKYRSVVMLNAGGSSDVVDDFEADDGKANAGTTFYIIDSHRPLNLANVYRDRGVYVFVDPETRDSFPRPDEVFSGGESDDDNDDGAGDPESDSPAKRRREGEDEDAPQAVARRARRAERDRRQREYYGSSYYGISAAFLVWKLAHDLGLHKDGSLVWLASVGITDQLLNDRIDPTTYLQLCQELVSAVNSLASDTGSINMHSKLQVKCEDDFPFMLLRHWSLMEAMTHSRYVATRLGVWRQKGQERLCNLFAKMGYSLEDCRQSWTSMQVSNRRDLSKQLDVYAGAFGLDNVTFPSFVVHILRFSYTSADVVYAVNGLLARTDPLRAGEDTSSIFFDALDGLSPTPQPRTTELLQRGIELAIRQHGAILRTIDGLLDGKRALRKTKYFRYALLSDLEDQALFRHPITLHRLGLFLVDAFRFGPDTRKKTMPLLLAALNPETDNYLVTGLWSNPRRDGGTVRNHFAMHFMTAIEQINARVVFTTFDSCVLEIKQGDMMRLVGALETHLSLAPP
eukprot:m.13490 g.13490  ORF g.13490 m.13490 type:complete len:589 (-) comp6191_c1_seq1:20-1786(-)